MTLPDDTLDELMALHAAGTQGEWVVHRYEDPETNAPSSFIASLLAHGDAAIPAEVNTTADAALIAAAVNNLPALVAEVQALREERDRLRVSFASDVSRAAGVMVSLTTRHGHKTDAAYLAAMVDLMAREAAKLEAAISAALEAPE
jgi:hypothetical protein